MSNVLILGANGSVAREAIDLFLTQTDATLTLYLRDPRKLKKIDSDRVRVIQGDVLDTKQLEEAMAGQDVVYANLAGDPPPRRFIAGADAIAGAEHKVAELKAQIEANRELSTSLDFDEEPAAEVK
jgi:uncharacterized protein YbjT (DUF2867 family)